MNDAFFPNVHVGVCYCFLWFVCRSPFWLPCAGYDWTWSREVRLSEWHQGNGCRCLVNVCVFWKGKFDFHSLVKLGFSVSPKFVSYINCHPFFKNVVSLSSKKHLCCCYGYLQCDVEHWYKALVKLLIVESWLRRLSIKLQKMPASQSESVFLPIFPFEGTVRCFGKYTYLPEINHRYLLVYAEAVDKSLLSEASWFLFAVWLVLTSHVIVADKQFKWRAREAKSVSQNAVSKPIVYCLKDSAFY